MAFCAKAVADAAAGVVKTAEDDGALAGRFVDLLRLVAFARADIITTRGAAAALPADAKKHRDRLRLQDPLEVSRDLTIRWVQTDGLTEQIDHDIVAGAGSVGLRSRPP